MLVTADAVQGTIGGGHLEFTAIDIARDATGRRRRRRWLRRFPLGASLGQCCGGVVNLAVRTPSLPRRNVGRDAAGAARARASSGDAGARVAARRQAVGDGSGRTRSLGTAEPTPPRPRSLGDLLADLPPAARQLARASRVRSPPSARPAAIRRARRRDGVPPLLVHVRSGAPDDFHRALRRRPRRPRAGSHPRWDSLPRDLGRHPRRRVPGRRAGQRRDRAHRRPRGGSRRHRAGQLLSGHDPQPCAGRGVERAHPAPRRLRALRLDWLGVQAPAVRAPVGGARDSRGPARSDDLSDRYRGHCRQGAGGDRGGRGGGVVGTARGGGQGESRLAPLAETGEMGLRDDDPSLDPSYDMQPGGKK